MIERTIYECEHCHKKRLMNKTQMKKHEDICWYNSKNKTCCTCKHEESFMDSGNVFVRICHKDICTEFDGFYPKVNCENWESVIEEDDINGI